MACRATAGQPGRSRDSRPTSCEARAPSNFVLLHCLGPAALPGAGRSRHTDLQGQWPANSCRCRSRGGCPLLPTSCTCPCPAVHAPGAAPTPLCWLAGRPIRPRALSCGSDLPTTFLFCRPPPSPPPPGVIPADPKQPFDVRAVLARLLDGSRFQEFKAQVGGAPGAPTCSGVLQPRCRRSPAVQPCCSCAGSPPRWRVAAAARAALGPELLHCLPHLQTPLAAPRQAFHAPRHVCSVSSEAATHGWLTQSAGSSRLIPCSPGLGAAVRQDLGHRLWPAVRHARWSGGQQW